LFLQQCARQHSEPASATTHSANSAITWVNDEHGQYAVTDNTTFFYLDDYQLSSHQVGHVVLQQRIVTAYRPDQECCETHITTTGTPPGRPSWVIKRDARNGEVYERFYRTTEGGCCGSNVRYRYFSLETGEQLFSATRPIAIIDVVESCCSLTRYFAVDRLSEPGDDTFVAKLQYGGEISPPQVTYLIVTPNSEDAAVSYIDVDFLQEGKRISSVSRPHDEAAYPADFPIFPKGYPHNPTATVKTITGFSLVLTIDKIARITIPVIEDPSRYREGETPA
jgi:hypothetical protein